MGTRQTQDGCAVGHLDGREVVTRERHLLLLSVDDEVHASVAGCIEQERVFTASFEVSVTLKLVELHLADAAALGVDGYAYLVVAEHYLLLRALGGGEEDVGAVGRSEDAGLGSGLLLAVSLLRRLGLCLLDRRQVLLLRRIVPAEADYYQKHQHKADNGVLVHKCVLWMSLYLYNE